jgi:phage-related minor tail protein
MSTMANLTVKLAADTVQFDNVMTNSTRALRQIRQTGVDVFNATRTPAENYEAALKQLTTAYRMGKVDVDTYGRATAKLKAEFDAANGAAGKTQSALGRIGEAAVGFGVAMTAAAAIRQSFNFITSSIQAFDEVKLQQDKLSSVLAATGHAAGFSAMQIGKLGSEIQSLTNYDDDAVAGAAAVLATFKQIEGATFERAVHAITDLSAVMGQDLQSSAVQVGKALNDPIRGITALRRVGVSFTKDQEAVIKSLAKMGDMAGAQKLILDELFSEFGGAAAGMRNELTGLSNDWGDLKEAIGGIFHTDLANSFFKGTAAAIREETSSLNDLTAASAIPGESKNRLKKVGLANGFREQLV